MIKNPLINALAATLYITLVASVMFYGQPMVPQADSVIMPIAMISLLTLSAAAMGYFFIFTPLRMYLDGDKQKAARLFVQTVGIFACTTIIIFLIMFFALPR